MAAGGGDVVAQGAAEGDFESGAAEDGGGSFTNGSMNGTEFGSGEGIELDEVDVGIDPPQVVDERVDVGVGVVDAFKKEDLDHHGVGGVCRRENPPQLVEGLGFGRRHELAAKVLPGRVETEGETDRRVPLLKSGDGGDHSHRGDHDVAVG